MSATPASTTAREALLAELIGDVQTLWEKLDAASGSATATAEALHKATQAHEAQIDITLDKVRHEFGRLILQTTEKAAAALVAPQTDALQAAAVKAMSQALTQSVRARARRDHMQLAALAGATGAVVSLLLQGLWLWTRGL
jgi:DsbC/DsbD-like thiol-disulfide interchange protein